MLCKVNVIHLVVQTLVVDCANGIGAPHLQTLSQQLQTSGFSLTARCTGDGILNGGCGADYIQKERAMPATFELVPDGSRCVCVSLCMHTALIKVQAEC